jgi:hypothetical protein
MATQKVNTAIVNAKKVQIAQGKKNVAVQKGNLLNVRKLSERLRKK